MAEIKESASHDVVIDNERTRLHVIWDCDDEMGYGVELSSDDAGLTSWSFGDNSLESYLLSAHLYAYVNEQIATIGNIPEELDRAEVHIDNDRPTAKQVEAVETIVRLLSEWRKEYALNKSEVDETRKSFGWHEQDSLWSGLVR